METVSGSVGGGKLPRKKRLQLNCGECRKKKVSLILYYTVKVNLLMSLLGEAVVRQEASMLEMCADRETGSLLI